MNRYGIERVTQSQRAESRSVIVGESCWSCRKRCSGTGGTAGTAGILGVAGERTGFLGNLKAKRVRTWGIENDTKPVPVKTRGIVGLY